MQQCLAFCHVRSRATGLMHFIVLANVFDAPFIVAAAAVLCIAFSVASYAIQWSVRDNAPLIAIPVGSASDPAATLEMVKCRRIILCCCCFFSISCSLKKHKLLKRNWWPLYTAVACLVYMHAWWWWWWCGETRKCMWAKLYTNSTYIYKVYIYF